MPPPLNCMALFLQEVLDLRMVLINIIHRAIVQERRRLDAASTLPSERLVLNYPVQLGAHLSLS